MTQWTPDSKQDYIFRGDFFSYFIQHCFICRPSDSTVPMDAGIEPRTVAAGASAVRRSNTRLDLIRRLDPICSFLMLYDASLLGSSSPFLFLSLLADYLIGRRRFVLLHCNTGLLKRYNYNYNVSLETLLWSFRNLCVKMWEEKFTKAEQ